MRRTTMAEVRPDAGRAARFSVLAQSTGWFGYLAGRAVRDLPCGKRPKGRSWPRNDPESEECRLRGELLLQNSAMQPSVLRTGSLSQRLRISPSLVLHACVDIGMYRDVRAL